MGEHDWQQLWQVCSGHAVADLYFLSSAEEKRVDVVWQGANK